MQPPPKAHVTRTNKSPVNHLKKPLDTSINSKPKVVTLARQSRSKKSIPEVKSIKSDAMKSMKKSLSNNDVNTSPSLKEELPSAKSTAKKQTVNRRQVPSSTHHFKSTSPSRDGTNKIAKKNAVIGPKMRNNGFKTAANVKTNQPSPQGKNPEPWVDFL